MPKIFNLTQQNRKKIGKQILLESSSSRVERKDTIRDKKNKINNAFYSTLRQNIQIGCNERYSAERQLTKRSLSLKDKGFVNDALFSLNYKK